VPSDQIGSLLPIWGWHPAGVGFFVFCVDFGVIMAIRRIFEGGFYWSRWWSFRVGDTIGLPVYAAFATVVMRDMDPSVGFYTWRWVHGLVLGAGFALSLGTNYMDVRSGMYTLRHQLIPSKLYHTFIFGVMFYWMATALPAVADSHSPAWAMGLSLSGLVVYVSAYLFDTLCVDRTPDPDGRR
jgi:hypothetical protein